MCLENVFLLSTLNNEAVVSAVASCVSGEQEAKSFPGDQCISTFKLATYISMHVV